MAAFDDSTDPALGAACNRLAAFCEAIPAGEVVDPASGLTEPDLVMILRALHRNRQLVDIPELTLEQAARMYGTAPAGPSSTDRRRGPWDKGSDA